MSSNIRPIESVFAFFYPLLRRGAAIIEVDYSFHRIAEVGDDEANPRKQFAPMPLHFCHHSSRNIPTLGLVTKVLIGDDGLLRGPLGRPYQQVRYFTLKHFVRWKPYGVTDAPCLQVLVKLGVWDAMAR